MAQVPRRADYRFRNPVIIVCLVQIVNIPRLFGVMRAVKLKNALVSKRSERMLIVRILQRPPTASSRYRSRIANLAFRYCRLLSTEALRSDNLEDSEEMLQLIVPAQIVVWRLVCWCSEVRIPAATSWKIEIVPEPQAVRERLACRGNWRIHFGMGRVGRWSFVGLTRSLRALLQDQKGIPLLLMLRAFLCEPQ